ncbi:hypothetical protein [Salinicoccus sp. HZC-1]|uniref:hypothetical protein n=1 Tax=Salinicoccus sp. HZC-1 TaxID=3385497 RepID=UPI00398ACF49
MKRYFVLFISVSLLLSACSEPENDAVVEVGAGSNNTDRDSTAEGRTTESSSVGDDADANDSTIEKGTAEEETSEDNLGTVEGSAELITYSEFEGSGSDKISELEPNNLAKKFESAPYDFNVEDNGSEDYRQSFDLDGDGNEEMIEIGYELDSGTDYKQYMIIISDHNGNPKYAEYLYNYLNEEHPQIILTVVDLDEDGYLDIVTGNNFAATATILGGYQSLGRIIYSFNSDLGQFTQMPVIGSYYENTLTDANLTVNVNNIITGFSESYSYIEDTDITEEEISSIGITDDSGDFNTYVENAINGQVPYVSPIHAAKINDDETFEIVAAETVYYNRAATIEQSSAYNWNDTYGWLEPIGTVLGHTEDITADRNLYDKETFNNEFKTDEVNFEDYLGEWRSVIDGRKINKHIDISESSITEIETIRESEEIEIEVAVKNYINKENTNQLMVTGEIEKHTEYENHNDYDNLFTLMNVEDQWLLMDKFGYFYIKE